MEPRTAPRRDAGLPGRTHLGLALAILSTTVLTPQDDVVAVPKATTLRPSPCRSRTPPTANSGRPRERNSRPPAAWRECRHASPGELIADVATSSIPEPIPRFGLAIAQM
jgi:hypothetical protein